MNAWRADPLVWGHGPRIFEVFLEPTCPFSVRAFGKLEDLLDKAGEDRITVKVRLQSQPWHTYSGVIVRCILAASTFEGGKTAAKSVMAAVTAHREEFEFDRHCTGPILVYFGYPRAHEDEAERSARAGLDIVDAMVELNAAVPPRGRARGADRHRHRTGDRRRPDRRRNRIGNRVVGETPNLAARLQALAQPNQIVVSAATRAMLGDHFDLEDLGGYELKGFAEPVLAWRVLSARDVESRFAATRTGSFAPLVGRQKEAGLLQRAWEKSCHGRGQVVLIQGEAGVGKSRLLEGLREATGNDHIWVAIGCSPFHTASAFHPIIEHLKRVFGWQPEDTAQHHLANLEAGLADFRALPRSESVRLFADLMSVPVPEDRYPRLRITAQQERNATLDAIVAWLIEVAERAPVLMAWEDLHWADPTTLEALGMLIEQAPTAAMLVVATYRPELTPPRPQRSHMTPITLNRLERPEVETMVGHLAGGRKLPGEVVDHIVAKADGVPLYVEELTKAILASGVLETRGDTYVLRGALAQLHVPETLQDSLMARLDRAPRLREMAQLGAVLGRESSYDMISALAGIEEDMLHSGLGQLVADELLYQRGRPPRSRYLFKHALIQDAAYQSLLKRTRQQYHQQVARLLEDRFPEVASTEPELVAHHYTEANCPAPAITYWHKAGAAAASRSAKSKPSTNFTEAWHWSKRYPICANGPSASWICKWRLVPPCTRPRPRSTPTLAEPMRGLGSSARSSGITPGSSRRSAACSSTIRTYSNWKRRSMLPRRRCVWPNGSTIRPASSGGTWRSACRSTSRGNSSWRLCNFGGASSSSIGTCSSRIGRVPTPACNASSGRR
jgi:class 3 adenylate cyclase